jgi:crotonobetainyl-CoA:carnitine CoA-transferase CaiB-like acyl-CoA transferase
MKILKDIRVIELGTYITGPAAARCTWPIWGRM